MRLSRLTVGLVGAVALALAAFVGTATAQRTATTITIATVNNGDMIVMEGLTSDFTKKYGIKVKYVTLPENTLRQKVTSDVATGGGQFDVVTVGTYDVPIWAKNKWLVSLQPYFAKGGAAKEGQDCEHAPVRVGARLQPELHEDLLRVRLDRPLGDIEARRAKGVRHL